MSLSFTKLHPLFMAQVSPVDLRTADEDTLAELRAGMDEYAVLVIRNQPFSDAEQLEFAQRFDGVLHAKTGSAVITKSRLGNEALSDISNLDENGEVMQTSDRRRMYALGNRLWHTDASFENPCGRYSMLHARVVPPVPADTEFADMRAAWDTLPPALQARCEGLMVHHSIAFSRQTLGFEFSEEEAERLWGAVHPLVRTIPRSGRRALGLASHAKTIVDWPVPDARLFLRDLMEHALQPQFRYVHHWQVNDLVIWDNRCTMHRGLPYEDTVYKRELRRVTTLDIPQPQHRVATLATSAAR